jgi:hypothetical protein
MDTLEETLAETGIQKWSKDPRLKEATISGD